MIRIKNGVFGRVSERETHFLSEEKTRARSVTLRLAMASCAETACAVSHALILRGCF